ncbi:MAG: GHKL domain-containing protein [Oscillospiraceae bacterium]|nr:GHKL domain-containing protein [Oscillospiraceae bacterium]
MGLVMIGDIISITLTPIIAFMFLKCFYDDSIQITGSKIFIYLLPQVLAVTVMKLAVFTDLIQFKFAFEKFTQLIYLITPVVIFCGRKKRIRYYIKNIILTVILSAFFNLTITTVAISGCMILMRTQIITSDSYNIFYYLLIFFSMIIIMLWLYIAFIRKHLTIPMRKRDTFLFFVYFLFVLMIFLTNNYHGEYGWDESWIIFVSVKLFMLLLMILIPVVIIKSRQSTYYNELSNRNEQFLELELTASNAYRKSQEDTRAFRHDMNNNLMIISALMKKNQYSEAEEYINSLFETLSSFSPKIVTGDNMLDSLFASKLPIIEEKSIKLDIKGVIDGNLDWKPIDICAVFANLIDNAIEACDKVTEKNRYIKVNIRKTDFQYIITFHNSVAQLVDCSKFNDNFQYTSKPEKKRHGFGMKNIRHTLAKYGAIMQISCTDMEFTTQIIIMK